MAAVIDARRGEVFSRRLVPGAPSADGARRARPGRPSASASESSVHGVLALGDGAVEFRAVLERSGALVAEDHSGLHRVNAINHCRLAHGRPPNPPDRRPAGVPPTSRRRDSPARRRQPMTSHPDQHPPAHLLGPPAGDRDRAALRSRRRGRWRCSCWNCQSRPGSAWRRSRAARSVGYLDLLEVRPGLAPDEHRGRSVGPPPRARAAAARVADRARRPGRVRTRWRSAPRTRRRSRCTSGSGSARPAPARGTTRTPARTR